MCRSEGWVNIVLCALFRMNLHDPPNRQGWDREAACLGLRSVQFLPYEHSLSTTNFFPLNVTFFFVFVFVADDDVFIADFLVADFFFVFVFVFRDDEATTLDDEEEGEEEEVVVGGEGLLFLRTRGVCWLLLSDPELLLELEGLLGLEELELELSSVSGSMDEETSWRSEGGWWT